MTRAMVIATTGTDLASVCTDVQARLGIPLKQCEGDYFGGIYYQGEIGSVQLMVIENFLDSDGELFEPEAPECKVVIHLEGESQDADSLVVRAGQIGLIQRVLSDKLC
jgi:hypothetical protein